MLDETLARKVVFWSGLASAASVVLFDLSIALGIAGAPTRLIAVVASLLLALSFVAFASALHSLSVPAQRVWTQIGLSFALLYAALLVWNYSLQLTVVRVDPNLYRWLSMDLTHGSAFWALETVGYALMGLAALFMLPVVPRGRLGTSSRWALRANALITGVGAVGYAVSGDPLSPPVVASLGVWSIAFPLGVVLMATALRTPSNGTAHDQPTSASG